MYLFTSSNTFPQTRGRCSSIILLWFPYSNAFARSYFSCVVFTGTPFSIIWSSSANRGICFRAAIQNGPTPCFFGQNGSRQSTLRKRAPGVSLTVRNHARPVFSRKSTGYTRLWPLPFFLPPRRNSGRRSRSAAATLRCRRVPLRRLRHYRCPSCELGAYRSQLIGNAFFCSPARLVFRIDISFFIVTVVVPISLPILVFVFFSFSLASLFVSGWKGVVTPQRGATIAHP